MRDGQHVDIIQFATGLAKQPIHRFQKPLGMLPAPLDADLGEDVLVVAQGNGVVGCTCVGGQNEHGEGIIAFRGKRGQCQS